MKLYTLNEMPSRKSTRAIMTAILCLAFAPVMLAQQIAPSAAIEPALALAVKQPVDIESETSSSRRDAPSLPDAPSSMLSATSTESGAVLIASLPAAAATNAPNNTVAPKYAKYIAPGETAQKLTAHDKVVIGLRDLYSFENLLAIPFAAGYEHLTNGQPNYGTNSRAFGQRIGAAAVRETSQGLFTDCVFAPLLRDDPRYFAQGDGVGFLHRTVYAVTRVLVTRTDNGHSTVNAPLLLGYAATSAMTPLYYPQINRNFKDTASNFGGSLGGAAIGFLFSEFSDSVLESLHFKKKP